MAKGKFTRINRVKTTIGPATTRRLGSYQTYQREAQRSGDQIVAQLESIINQMAEATPDVIYEAMEPTFHKSQIYCPKDTGDLVESGYLEIASRAKQAPYVEIGYGYGGKPDYTVFVHEIPYNHAPPTRWKWLQAAVMEDLTQIWEKIGRGFGSFLGG